MSSTLGARSGRWVIAVTVGVALSVGVGVMQKDAKAEPAASKGASERDGSEDFDFALGAYTYHLSKLDQPLSGSQHWDRFEGKGHCQPVFRGAQVDEVEAVGPGGQRTEALTLRMYSPQTHEWTLYWGSQGGGTISLPATVGHFEAKNGHGEFFDDEIWHGKAIKVRWIWSDITAQSARFEQAFSIDGGKTWETNWVTTREPVAGAS